MKIRHGFVSNSSTTSFCIVGVEFCLDDVPDENLDGGDVLDSIENYIHKHNLQLDCYCAWESEYYYLGLDIDKIKNEDRFGDFRQKAQAQIDEVLANTIKIPSPKCGIITES
ncbi:MAG: hypothetical protein WC942_06805, partial [Clostridia bacterium]